MSKATIALPKNRIRTIAGVTTAVIVFMCDAALVPCGAQQPDSARSEAAEYQKVVPVVKFLRNRNARDYAVSTPNGIDEAEYVNIGGIPQWITIRGEDRRNPVLLFLHGGPGDATNPWGYAAFRSWLRYFTVVQWDQRGAGRTFGRNRAGPDTTITAERMVEDGIELSEFLSKKLHVSKLVLVGHSWGSVLGVFMAKARPDLFYAYVGTGQVAAEYSRASVVAYDAMVQRATRDGNVQALRELKDIGPPPYKDGKGFGIQRKWSLRFEGGDVFLASALGFALTAPGYTAADINDWFDGQNASGEQLGPHFDELDRKILTTELAVPVFIIQGAEDYNTPTSLARAYVQTLHAPHKAFVTIDGAGHFAVFTKQEAFLRELRARVLPLVRHDLALTSRARQSTHERTAAR